MGIMSKIKETGLVAIGNATAFTEHRSLVIQTAKEFTKLQKSLK